MIKTGFLILSLVLNVFFILKGIYSRPTDTPKIRTENSGY